MQEALDNFSKLSEIPKCLVRNTTIKAIASEIQSFIFFSNLFCTIKDSSENTECLMKSLEKVVLELWQSEQVRMRNKLKIIAAKALKAFEATIQNTTITKAWVQRCFKKTMELNENGELICKDDFLLFAQVLDSHSYNQHPNNRRLEGIDLSSSKVVKSNSNNERTSTREKLKAYINSLQLKSKHLRKSNKTKRYLEKEEATESRVRKTTSTSKFIALKTSSEQKGRFIDSDEQSELVNTNTVSSPKLFYVSYKPNYNIGQTILIL